VIKAIETTYKGYRFRSRLEARWAVFFDACGYQWEYEPEGFEVGGIYYLPDFRIFGKDDNGDYNVFWIEVKPIGMMSREEHEKIVCFSAFLLHQQENYDQDRPGLIQGYGDFILLEGPPEIGKMYKGLVSPVQWIMDDSYRGRPSFWNDYDEYIGIFGEPKWIKKSPYELARSARFEHGARP